MERFLRFSLLAAVGLLTACQTLPEGPAPDFVPDMVVSTDYALFFRLGPQQAGGADLSLRTNETVMLLRKEFGYSRVQLENGLVGYMANEDIQPAPEPPPDPERKRMPPKKEKKSGRGSSQSYRSYEENLPVPDPNLGLLPDDVPLDPLPDLLPENVDFPEPTPPPTPPPAPVKEQGIPETEDEPKPPVSTST